MLGGLFECFAAVDSGPLRTADFVVDGLTFAGPDVDETRRHQFFDCLAGRQVADGVEQHLGESVFDLFFIFY